MCGIFGVVSAAPIAAGVLETAQAIQKHRGPDAQAVQRLKVGRWHVGLAHQTLQRVELLWLAQIEPCRQFAVAGVVFLIIARCDVRGSDLQDVGTVFGQGARTGGARQHPGQVEHANARERPVALGQFLRRSVANLEDLH